MAAMPTGAEICLRQVLAERERPALFIKRGPGSQVGGGRGGSWSYGGRRRGVERSQCSQLFSTGLASGLGGVEAAPSVMGSRTVLEEYILEAAQLVE